MIARMTESLGSFQWALDGWIIVAGVLCAVASALLGPFLVLRRMSMMGDAISHAVLPGIAVAFLITDSRASLPMFIGAAVVGVLTAVFTEWVRGFGKVDEGASMGVVFTVLFAIGLAMIAWINDVSLDPHTVLFGEIEYTVFDRRDVAGVGIPATVIKLGIICALNLLCLVLFYKELKISSFDPALSASVGIRPALMHYLLMVLVALTVVASFESVGNILVVAMLVVPAATAYLLTDRLFVMIGLSVILGVLAGVFGHLGAIAVPAAFGYPSTNTAGMMAVASGVLFGVAGVVSPKHGLVAAWRRRKAPRPSLLKQP